MDAVKESCLLTEEERGKDNDLRAEMFTILKQKEIYWKQRSRVTWLKEGDENTSYFTMLPMGAKIEISFLGFYLITIE